MNATLAESLRLHLQEQMDVQTTAFLLKFQQPKDPTAIPEQKKNQRLPPAPQGAELRIMLKQQSPAAQGSPRHVAGISQWGPKHQAAEFQRVQRRGAPADTKVEYHRARSHSPAGAKGNQGHNKGRDSNLAKGILLKNANPDPGNKNKRKDEVRSASFKWEGLDHCL